LLLKLTEREKISLALRNQGYGFDGFEIGPGKHWITLRHGEFALTLRLKKRWSGRYKVGDKTFLGRFKRLPPRIANSRLCVPRRS
jgi:hypothetical protein